MNMPCEKKFPQSLKRRKKLFSIFLIAIALCINNFTDAQVSNQKALNSGDLGKRVGTDLKLGELKFIQNKNQFDKSVEFKAPIKGGEIFIQKDGFSYDYRSEEDWNRVIELRHSGKEIFASKKDLSVQHHGVKVKFEKANKNPIITGHKKVKEYYNYILGNDKSKWAGNVPLYKELKYENIYDGIDVIAYGNKEGNFKYDFIVSQGANPEHIRLSYNGPEGLELKSNGNLHIYTSVGEIIEHKPYAYQIVNGKQIEVPCEYKLIENLLTYSLPSGYDKSKSLIIDPTVEGATFIGNTENSFGHTATFGLDSTIYLGCVLESTTAAGFVPTAGVWQQQKGGTANSDRREMLIAKFNQNASQMIYGTFLGGTRDDWPHSMIVASDSSLFILGSTGEIDAGHANTTDNTTTNDFPMAGTPYQPNYAGGTDIIVARLSNDGSSLIASTYLGGSTKDGHNKMNLRYNNDNFANWGDNYRGEIFLDASDNVYIASATESTDFPKTTGVFQENKSGGQDGVMVKLDKDLSTLIWSTYVGGTGDDACYGVKVDDNGDIFLSGSAGAGFPNKSGIADPTHNGGQDAFIMKFNPTATTVVESKLIGSTGNDQMFFTQIDKNNKVYVLGQTDNVAVIPDASNSYSGITTGEGTFISILSNDLLTIEATAKFRRMAPTALLVDDCDRIYLAGYKSDAGGALTNFDVISEDPITSPLKTQSGTGGFYIGVLSPDADDLIFGVYYGHSSAHVDGGTSRFSKSGVIYEAVCTRTDPTSTTNPTFEDCATGCTTDWNGEVVKIKLDFLQPVADADTLGDQSGCQPYTAQFNATSSTPDHLWYFDYDGDRSLTTTNPDTTWEYFEPGTYLVKYIAIDSSKCIIADTIDFVITVDPFSEFKPEPNIPDVIPCTGVRELKVDFSVEGSNFEVTWDPGIGTPVTNNDNNFSYSYTIPGVYYTFVSVLDLQCNKVSTASDTIVFDIGHVYNDLIVPNIITDDGDGKNDVFRVEPIREYAVGTDNFTYDFEIYNRWGRKIFEGDQDNDWDASKKGKKPVEAGVYYYVLNFKGTCAEREHTFRRNGHVTVVR